MDENLNLLDLVQRYGTEPAAREYLEGLRWPEGTICPHCGAAGAYRLMPKAESVRPVRAGVWKCKVCRKQFTVRVGTIFEDSHIPLSTWVIAIHLMCASKKGISAHQLHRMLGVTYKSAWFLAHRIRFAMSQPPLVQKLSGIVEIDETYIGPKNIKGAFGRKTTGRSKGKKQIVVSLVERGGNVRSIHAERVTGANLRSILRIHVDRGARIMSDEFSSYRGVRKDFPSHETVNHSRKEYVRGDVHVNSAEGFFGLLKRGIVGTYHHVSERHLHRYLAEFDFRWNGRTVSDGARAVMAAKDTEGKRLTYRPLVGSPS